MARRKKKTGSSSTVDRKRLRRKWLMIMWGLAVGAVMVLFLLFFLLSRLDLPTFEELENPDIELSSTIVGLKGEEIGRYYVENRVSVTFEELNPHLVKALISTEDIRYYEHSGIDFIALARVLGKTIFMGRRSSGGGSTISQQLAKLLYPRRNFSGMSDLEMMFSLAITKFKEWITAVKLERSYTKEEIIAMYLNEFDFINGAHGIQAASETYFGTPQEKLNPEEAALLIGMLKNPSLYNPVRFPENAKIRRRVVLHQMEKANHLTETEYDSLTALPIDMSSFSRSSHIKGPAPYFRMELAKQLKELFEKEEYRKSNGKRYNIYRDGLKIYVTIDLGMQRLAEQVMKGHMKEIQSNFFSEWEDRDPWEYRFDGIPVDYKQEALQSAVRRSERFTNLFGRTMGSLIERVLQAYDQRLDEEDLKRLREAAESEGRIKRWLAERRIDRDRAAFYRDVLEDPVSDTLITTYTQFEKEVERVFNQPVSMTVFAYNKQMETDTVMSPLDSIKYHRMILQTGILAMDPDNGEIRVWVGGVNHKYFKYDHIETPRQVGSTFKPLVYATAISIQAISPCFPVADVRYTIEPGEGNFGLIKPWTPRNASGEYSQKNFTLYEGLKHSKNTVSVYLMKQLGDVTPVIGLIDAMGIDSSAHRSDGSYRVPRQPSICLGAADLTVKEMTSAYATFANGGLYNKPIIIRRIEDKNGRVIYRSQPESQLALDPEANYVMVDMLKYAVRGNPHFRGIDSEVGGKTGTTNKHTDGWFMGVTPDLVVGTWVGGEDRWIRFRNFQYGQGAVMARPFFTEFIRRLEEHPELEYDQTARFAEPAGDLNIETDCDKYKRLNPDDQDPFQGFDQFAEPPDEDPDAGFGGW